MAAVASDVQRTWKHGIIAMVLWTYSSKRGVFCFTVTVRVHRFSSVSRVSRISRVIGLGLGLGLLLLIGLA